MECPDTPSWKILIYLIHIVKFLKIGLGIPPNPGKQKNPFESTLWKKTHQLESLPDNSFTKNLNQLDWRLVILRYLSSSRFYTFYDTMSKDNGLHIPLNSVYISLLLNIIIAQWLKYRSRVTHIRSSNHFWKYNLFFKNDFFFLPIWLMDVLYIMLHAIFHKKNNILLIW